MIILLIQPWWCGTEDRHKLAPAHLRVLFVQYSGQSVRSSWAERWESPVPHQFVRLPQVLGRLIG